MPYSDNHGFFTDIDPIICPLCGEKMTRAEEERIGWCKQCDTDLKWLDADDQADD